MNKEHRRPTWPIIVGLVLVLLPPLLYGGGYFFAGNYFYSPSQNIAMRAYPYRWLARAYKPLGTLETWITGRDTQSALENASRTTWESLANSAIHRFVNAR